MITVGLLAVQDAVAAFSPRDIIVFQNNIMILLRCDIPVVLVKSQNYTADAWSQNTTILNIYILNINIYITIIIIIY